MDDHIDFPSRLRALMDTFSLSMNQLAKEIDTPIGSIAGYLNDGREPKLSFFAKILSRFSTINADWLIQGKGPMLKGYDLDAIQKELSEVQEKLALYQKLERERENTQRIIREAEKKGVLIQ